MKNCRRGLTVALVLGALLGSGCKKESERPPTYAEERAEARAMVQEVLDTWEWRTWNQLLAEDVVLTLKLGTVGAEAAIGLTDSNTGRDEAKEVLREIYGDLEKRLSIWGELADGPEIALLADLNVAQEGEAPQELPLVVYMKFNESGKIEEMTLLSIDLRPLRAALDAPDAGVD